MDIVIHGAAEAGFYPIMIRSLNGGVQLVFEFGNGYGASVVRHGFSYGSEAGLWELVVLKRIA